jgi:hypothetical protein
MSRQQIAKLLYLKSRRFMMGLLARHCHQIKPIIPTTNKKLQMQIRLETNQSFHYSTTTIISG